MLQLDVLEGSEEDLACTWCRDVGRPASKQIYWSTFLTLWLEQLIKIQILVGYFWPKGKEKFLNPIFYLTWTSNIYLKRENTQIIQANLLAYIPRLF